MLRISAQPLETTCFSRIIGSYYKQRTRKAKTAQETDHAMQRHRHKPIPADDTFCLSCGYHNPTKISNPRSPK